MTPRVLGIVCLIVAITGCGGPPAVRVASTKVTFRTHADDVLTFDADIRKGDSICWQHGDGGTETAANWKTDQVTVLTVSKTANRLDIVCSNAVNHKTAESISTESVTLFETPKLNNGKYHVANYVRKMGVARTPETPLYVYAKKAE
jgi:hypothetical protein